MRKFIEDKIVTLGFVAIATLLIVVIVVTRATDNQLKKNSEILQKSDPVLASKFKLVAPKVEHAEALVPDDPEKYGVVMYRVGSEPKTSEQIEMSIAERYEEVKSQMPEKFEKAFAKAELSEEEYQNRLDSLTSRLKELQEEVKLNPDDEEMVSEIHDLKVLIAMTKAMKNDIIK